MQSLRYVLGKVVIATISLKCIVSLNNKERQAQAKHFWSSRIYFFLMKMLVCATLTVQAL